MSVTRRMDKYASLEIHLSLLGAAACALCLSALSFASSSAQAPPPPPTKTVAVVDTLHGKAVPDPYRWLENDDSPETRQWIDAQNAYARRILDPLPGRRTVRNRLERLLRVETASPPLVRRGREIFARRGANQQLAAIVVREAAEERVLVDPNGLSRDGRLSVTLLDASRDGRLMAYGVRDGVQDEMELRLLDVDAAEDVDTLPRARYRSVVVAPDRSGVFYTVSGRDGPRVRWHTLRTPAQQDVTIFGDAYGAEHVIDLLLAPDGQRMAIVVWKGDGQSDVYLREQFGQNLMDAVVRGEDAAFTPAFAGPDLILHTTLEAPRGRVLKVPLSDLRRERWMEIVPQSEAVIEAVAAVGRKVLVTQLRDVQSRLTVYDTEGLQQSDIALPTMGSVSAVVGNWDDDGAFFTFTSFNVPAVIYRYDVATSERTVWWRPDVPLDANAIAVRQVWVRSKDGTRVPMFLAHRPGFVPDSAAPTLLTGSGGFNDALTPSFSVLAADLVERGGIYAVVALRGGGEFGADWHRAGMLDKKQNAFDDFIVAAEWLIAEGYTNPSKLAIRGDGNGGLLVGASMMQRPELFQAVVSERPLLDMVRYHRFSLARSWVPEYGSSEDPVQFQWLIGYSPYHRVRPGSDYPAVLLRTRDEDTRVAPLHARKMAALLQAASTGRRPVMLLYDTMADDAHVPPMDKLIDDATDELMFLFWQLRVPVETR